MADTVTVEKLVYGGEGLSRLNGKVLLTPLVLPGETVTVEQRDKLHSRLLRVDQPAPERVKAPCPYFGACGGCHYQHAPYEFQLEQKISILREVLQRVGKLEPPEEIDVVRGPEWNYRNRVQLHVENEQVGFRQLGSHSLCAITHCPISSPKLNEAIDALSEMVKERRFPTFVEGIEFFTNETEIQVNILQSSRPVAKHFFEWCAERIPGVVPGALQYGSFRVSGRSFFQVNRFLVEALIDAAIGEAKGRTALDLYAGVGLFTLPLKDRFETVTAVESGAASLDDLRWNAQRAGADIEAVKSSVDEYLSTLESAPDLVLADPPRDGLGKSAVRHLLRLRPARLHLVACDPATLARDLAHLVQGGYRIERMTMVDLFPQTYHLETLVHLTLQ